MNFFSPRNRNRHLEEVPDSSRLLENYYASRQSAFLHQRLFGIRTSGLLADALRSRNLLGTDKGSDRPFSLIIFFLFSFFSFFLFQLSHKKPLLNLNHSSHGC